MCGGLWPVYRAQSIRLILSSVCLTHWRQKDIETKWPQFRRQHFQIFLNENVWIPLKFSLKFVPKVRINNIPALVQIMAWHRQGNNPLSDLMMVSLPTQICVTRPQRVNIKSILSLWYFMQYMGQDIFSLPISFVMIEKIFVIYIISINKKNMNN